MAITVNIAPNISTTQYGNFVFTVLLDDISADQVIDYTSFAINKNLTITDSMDISLSNLILLNSFENVFFISVIIPSEVQGIFTVGVNGNIRVDGINYELSGSNKTISYDTIRTVRIRLG